jgi:tRNA threonylcarbamoyladenosine biosynthesis protein TsaE
MDASNQYIAPWPLVWQRTYSLQEVGLVALEVLQWSNGIPVWLLEGNMGAGKTTFVRAVCEALGVQDPVNSPTFAIIQEYQTATGDAVFHIDGYRLENENQIEALGIESVLRNHQRCFIEWPGLFLNRLEGYFIRIEWLILEGEIRNLKMSCVGNK